MNTFLWLTLILLYMISAATSATLTVNWSLGTDYTPLATGKTFSIGDTIGDSFLNSLETYWLIVTWLFSLHNMYTFIWLSWNFNLENNRKSLSGNKLILSRWKMNMMTQWFFFYVEWTCKPKNNQNLLEKQVYTVYIIIWIHNCNGQHYNCVTQFLAIVRVTLWTKWARLTTRAVP